MSILYNEQPLTVNPELAKSKEHMYRIRYKSYYGIAFNSEYVIHHIDQDKSNNKISNLILLPRNLHTKLHTCWGLYRLSDSKLYEKIFDTLPATIDDFRNLMNIQKELLPWIKFKEHLDFCKDNGLDYDFEFPQGIMPVYALKGEMIRCQ